MKKATLTVALALTILIVGCAQTTTNINDKKNDQSEVTIEEPQSTEPKTKEVRQVASNNGGNYVRYNQDVYYRQYQADNYAPSGLFQTYETMEGTMKNMMVYQKGKEAEVAFEDDGEGSIYIANDRMFLQKTKEWVPHIYSVKLDGTQKVEIGVGTIQGLDEETGILVCSMPDENEEYQLASIDTATLNQSIYELEYNCTQFLGIKDSQIIYSYRNADEDKEEFKLCSVLLDGSSEREIVTIKEDLYEDMDILYTIPCVQLVDDTIYFSYGGYAGTGNFYQGGAIAKVDLDGSNFEQSTNLFSDIFLVRKEGDNHKVYCNRMSEESQKGYYEINVKTGEYIIKDLPIYKLNQPFEDEKVIKVYEDEKENPMVLIPSVDYELLGDSNEKYSYSIKDIQVCDDYVYYRLEASEYSEEESIGWRDGYIRIKSVVARNKIGTTEAEKLFEY